jgi:hypothetical protein
VAAGGWGWCSGGGARRAARSSHKSSEGREKVGSADGALAWAVSEGGCGGQWGETCCRDEHWPWSPLSRETNLEKGVSLLSKAT